MHKKKEYVFQRPSNIFSNHPGWEKEYSRELWLSASFTVFAAYFLYLCPWTFEFNNMHGHELLQSFLQLIEIWVVFLIVWLLLVVWRAWHQRSTITQSPDSDVQSISMTKNAIQIASLYKLLYCYSILAMVLAFIMILEDLFEYNRFQSVPVTLATIFFFVVFWPHIRISFIFLGENSIWLWRKLSKKQVFEIIFANPSSKKIQDIL